MYMLSMEYPAFNIFPVSRANVEGLHERDLTTGTPLLHIQSHTSFSIPLLGGSMTIASKLPSERIIPGALSFTHWAPLIP